MKTMVRLAALLLIAAVSWSEASAEETVPWNTGVAVTYDESGNIKQVGTDLYRYDVAGRLLRSDANGARWNYTYDAYGNRQTCTVVSTSSDCQGVAVNSANNRLSAPAVYDNAGNVTGLNSRTYSYDALNMQTRDSGTGVTVEYVYTADDERIAVYTTTTGAWRWTLRGASAKVLRELTSADVAGGTVGAGSWAWVKDYVWRDDLLLATRQREQAGQTPTTYHYHLDHLGTPRRVTNDNDIIVGVHDYHAFGIELSSGTNEPSHTPLQFTGHERDGTLDYMHARYYQASLGRFLSTDPGRDWELKFPQSWNLYTYARNSPILVTDPTGQFIKELFDFFHDFFRKKLDEKHPPAKTDTADPNYQALTDRESGAPTHQAEYLTNKPGVAQTAVNEAGAVVGAAGATAGVLVAAEAVTSVAARLSQSALDHIVYRHWATSGFTNVGRFAPGTTARSLRTMIDTASTLGTRTPDRLLRTRIEIDLGRHIGVDMYGRAATRLRVIITHSGEVVTAFPIK